VTKLHVTFTPDRLGAATTVEFTIQIKAPANAIPSPLTALDMSYPGNLGITTSGLGLATCTETILEYLGPEGCPADSRMGQGSALAEIPIGPAIDRETAEVAIFRTPERNGQLSILFYANAPSPLSAQAVLPGQLLPEPDQGHLTIEVPLITSLPGGPNVAIIRLHATLGPRGLTYYEHIHNKFLSYHPNGILLPDRCPHGGFPFTASLTFEDGSHTSTSTTVPCSTANTSTATSSNTNRKASHSPTNAHTEASDAPPSSPSKTAAIRARRPPYPARRLYINADLSKGNERRTVRRTTASSTVIAA
jgi:hypothetical protein